MKLDLPVAGTEEQLVYEFAAPILIPSNQAAHDKPLTYRMARFGRTHITGNVDLTNATCRALLLNGCCVEGVVSCDGGQFDEISAVPAISLIRANSDISFLFPKSQKDGASKEEPTAFVSYINKRKPFVLSFPAKPDSVRVIGVLVMNSEMRGFRMRDAQVKGRLWMHGVSIRVDLDADNHEIWSGNESVDHSIDSKMSLFTARFPNEAGNFPENVPAFQIENCLVRGPVLLFDPDFSKEWLFRQTKWDKDRLFEALVTKPTSGDDTKLSGDSESAKRAAENETMLAAEIDKLLATIDRSRVHGDLRIENTMIDGKLVLSNLDVRGCIEVKDVVLKSDLVAGSPRRHPEITDDSAECVVTTEARSLDLEMLNCDGDVLLPGLRLKGNLSGRNIQVRGHFELLSQGALGRQATTKQTRNEKACSAIVAGKIDLGGSKIAWLQCLANNQGDSENSWCLEQTTIKRLVFYHPFPPALNMRSAEAQAIDLPDDPRPHKFRNTLRSQLFKICEPRNEFSTMSEKLLRKEGARDIADYVYYKEHGFRGILFWLSVSPVAAALCWAVLILLFIGALFVVKPEANWVDDHPTNLASDTQGQPNSSAQKNPNQVIPKTENWFFLWRAVEIALPIVNIRSQGSGEETRLKDSGWTQTFFGLIPCSHSFTASSLSLFGWIVSSFLFVNLSGLAKRE